MPIYIMESNLSDAKSLKKILKQKYKETFIVKLKSMLIESGPSRIPPNSMIIIKGEFNDSTMEATIHYCRKHQIPLLAIVDKNSFHSIELSLEDDMLFDIVTDPTDSELFLRVNLLLKYQREISKRVEKERELAGALEHITEELEFAKKVQQLVLPTEFTATDIQFKAIYEPSAQLSGDLYFWIKVSDHEYGFIIIDVSGHGVHASLVSMAMRSLFPGLLKRVKEPKDIAQELNNHMLTMFEKFSEHNKFVTSYFTAIILKINTLEKTISYVNAGHQPGLVWDNMSLKSLESSMIPIGLIQNPIIESETVHYSSPTKLLLFTDGLTEIPYSIKVNRIDKVKEDFVEMSNLNEDVMLQMLLDQRKKESQVYDDICAVAITLY